MYTWGCNDANQLGRTLGEDQRDDSNPANVPAFEERRAVFGEAQSVHCGSSHSAVLTGERPAVARREYLEKKPPAVQATTIVCLTLCAVKLPHVPLERKCNLQT